MIHYLLNLTTFLLSWMLCITAADYLFHITSTPWLMLYGWVAMNLCSWVSDTLTPTPGQHRRREFLKHFHDNYNQPTT